MHFRNHFSKLTWIKNKLFLLGWIPLWGGRSSRVHTTVLILGFLFWRLQDLQKIQMAPLYCHIIKALSIKFIMQNTKFRHEVLWKEYYNYCPSRTAGCYDETEGLVNYQTWKFAIKFCNFPKSKYYVNLQMMGLPFKF